mmetsp:Transcript_1453/g.6482  ORF Transcript_1453/g.6482 Transcript_1453/m.6482 type:complete len:205 (-) Transcript_1453:1649-2263(-)
MNRRAMQRTRTRRNPRRRTRRRATARRNRRRLAAASSRVVQSRLATPPDCPSPAVRQLKMNRQPFSSRLYPFYPHLPRPGPTRRPRRRGSKTWRRAYASIPTETKPLPRFRLPHPRSPRPRWHAPWHRTCSQRTPRRTRSPPRGQPPASTASKAVCRERHLPIRPAPTLSTPPPPRTASTVPGTMPSACAPRRRLGSGDLNRRT